MAGFDFKLEKVVDLNVMARRALKEEMPGMVLRGFTRAVAKGVLQDQLQKNGGTFGAILGMVGAVASVATEQADDRMWRMLPGRVYVARGYLPPGEHSLRVNGRELEQPVKIEGQYAVVPLRFYHSSVLNGDVASLGQLVAVADVPPAPALAPAAATRSQSGTAASRPARATRTVRAGKSATPAAVAAPAAAAAAAIAR